jgi:hypothetical protein
LPDNYVSSIAMDGTANKWIGTLGGLAVYRAGGVVTVEINNLSLLPSNFTLYQNYPNPFNPSTKIKYTIPNSVETLLATSLRVYDILGREVATLINQELSAGTYEVEFSVRNGSASGVYFYQLRAGSFVDTKKMIVIK